MIGVIIQARSGSTRFPRKIYEDLCGKSTLHRVLESVKHNQMPHKIILAMPEYDKEEFLERFDGGEFDGAIDGRFGLYFGSSDDLVKRYYGAANSFGIDLIVRVTADCPFGGVMIDEMLIEYLKNGCNGYMGNNEAISCLPQPDGVDCQIFPYWLLVETMQLTDEKDTYYREHVCTYMYRRGTSYKLYPFLNANPNTIITMKHRDFSFDTKKDMELLKKIIKNYDSTEELYPTLTKAKVLDIALRMTNE